MSDHPPLIKFARKSYRDGYLSTQVRAGIGLQIHAIREKCELSQIEFAKKTGKAQSVISRIESSEYGKVSVQTLLDVACANDVALLIQFTSYPDFFERTKDMSIEALQPQTIHESLEDEAKSPKIIRLQNFARASETFFNENKGRQELAPAATGNSSNSVVFEKSLTAVARP